MFGFLGRDPHASSRAIRRFGELTNCRDLLPRAKIAKIAKNSEAPRPLVTRDPLQIAWKLERRFRVRVLLQFPTLPRQYQSKVTHRLISIIIQHFLFSSYYNSLINHSSVRHIVM